MLIKIQCPSCQQRYAVKDKLAGKKIRCSQCQGVISVAATAASKPESERRATRSPAAPSGKVQRRSASTVASVSEHDGFVSSGGSAVNVKPRLQKKRSGPKPIPKNPDAFQQWLSDVFRSDEIQPVTVSATYRLAVILVTLLMIAIPIVYAGLMGLLGVGTWLGVKAVIGAVGSTTGGIIGIFLVLTAVAIVLFMLKPLFSRPPHNNGRRVLNRDDEPFVFEFVERICDIVNAPYPQQIVVDCTINAAAGLNRGFLSLFGGDMSLTIGLSMVAGLDVRQFAGVLAHEFGHFSQGTGMRVSLIIRSISHWLTRVVYERDAWDLRLYESSRQAGPLFGIVLYAIRFGVWGTRKILWLLMMAGHAVSGFLLRQMEFDADRYESRVAGHKSFASTSRRMSVLQVAYRGAISDLQQFYDEGRLADDLPGLIVVNVPEIPAKVRKKLKQAEEEATTGFFDTHPCFTDRAENAAADGSAGIISCQNAAQELFRKFDIRSRGVTIDFYREIFGDKFQKKLIRPLSEVVEVRRVQQASIRALRRYFRGHFSWYRSVSLPADIWTPEDQPPDKPVLLSNRQEVLNLAAKYEKAWKKYNKAENQLVEAKLARTLIGAGFQVGHDAFSIPLTTRGQIRQAIDKVGVKQGKAEPVLRDFEAAAAERMGLTLRMARSKSCAQPLQKMGFRLGELDDLLQIYNHIYDNVHQLVEIHDQQMILGKLMELIAAGHRHDAVIGSVTEQMDFLSQKIAHLHKLFLQTDYPFDHARAGITLAEYILKSRRLPAYDSPLELYNAAENIAMALPIVQARVLGRLCEFSEAVEMVAGLSPLEDLPDEDDDDSDADA